MTIDEDKKAYQDVVEIFNDQINPTYQLMEVIWFRNVLYYLGEQWIQWIPNQRTFTKRFNTKGLFANTKPTPTSNIIRDHIQSIKAMIINKDFSVKIWPNSEEKEDRDASAIGEDLLSDIHASHDSEFDDEKEKIAVWLGLAGNGFMRTFPEMNNGTFGIDRSGDMVPKGEVANECIIPFNVRVDDYGSKLRHKRYVGIQSLKPREWVEDTFGVKIASNGEMAQVNYQRRLEKLVSNVSPWKGSSNTAVSSGFENDDLVLFQEVEYKPTPKYPEGRYLIASGGQLVQNNKKMPIPVGKDGAWDYSLTDFHYYYAPGRFWSDPSVNDLISPQNLINQIDQDQQVNRRSLGKPWIIQPVGTKLNRKSSKGSGLRAIEWDPKTTIGGLGPTVVQAAALPATVANERQTQVEVAQNSSGDPKGVLRGKAPSSTSSGVMVDILRDTAEQSHYPDIARFYRSLQRVDRKNLIIAQVLYTENRIIKISGKGNNIRVRVFKGADLRNNTDVRLELASGLSSTNAGKISTIMELVEKGFFGDITQDPEMRNQLLLKLGLADFRDSISIDIERAESENGIVVNIENAGDDGDSIFLTEMVPAQDGQGNPVPETDQATGEPAGRPMMEEVVVKGTDDPLFKYDNHAIHYETHRRFILSREFKTLPVASQAMMVVHTDIHHKILQAEAMAQQQAEMQAEMAKNPPEDELDD